MAFMIRLTVLAFLIVNVVQQIGFAEANTGVGGERQAEIDALIEQLGAPQFAHREKAHEQLRDLGVVAFESLHAAQFHPDVEIRKQAGYLLRAIRISWVQDSDSQEVRRILGQYQTEDFEKRLERLRELVRVQGDASFMALCRLARFETSENISKRAALAILQRDDVPTNPDQFASRMDKVLGPSERTAVQWLHAYAANLIDPSSAIGVWKSLCDQEVDFVQRYPDKNRRIVLRELLRWHVEMLHRQSFVENTSAAMAQLLNVHGDDELEIRDTADWLLDLSAWQRFDQLVSHFPRQFEEVPHLRYRVAEALQDQGQEAAANALVDKILEMQIQDRPFLHVELGYHLQMRGLFQWAEQEYRRTIETVEPTEHASIESTIRLGWMFHDLGRHGKAYEAYRPLVELMTKAPAMKGRIQELSHRPEMIRGQMHFSRGLQLGEEEKYAQQKSELEKAIARDRENADILIAMYRIPDDDEPWKQKTNRLIDDLRRKYEDSIRSAEQDLRQNPDQSATRRLAQQLNQFAWLVSNTFGDYRQALKSSQRSLQLIAEDGGYLDTLARCYYALDDLENALKYQRRAVELEPNSGQIRRQLDLFESVAAERAAG